MSSIKEREAFSSAITKKIQSGWVIAVTSPAPQKGDAQIVYGPMLLTPYVRFKNNNKQSVMAYAVVGDAITGNAHRLIYDAVVNGGSAGYTLVRDTFDVAYLSPLTEAPDLRPDWRAEKKMLFSSSASEAYLMELGLLL